MRPSIVTRNSGKVAAIYAVVVSAHVNSYVVELNVFLHSVLLHVVLFWAGVH